MSYVMIENYLNGCYASLKVVGVTLDQQFASTWLQSGSEPFIVRQIEAVPIYS